MAQLTQYERIIAHLRKVGEFGASYLSLTVVCRANCPWKRIAELEARGYIFRRWTFTVGSREHTCVALVDGPR